MSDLSLSPRTPESSADEPLLDTLLREAVPEIKLSLGDLIDRDGLRAVPDRFAKLLPQSVLVVTLRPDAAEAVRPIAAELEEELTDSAMRHGSLYDREYRVKLRVANTPGAPLFRVSVRKANEPEPEPFPPPPPPQPVAPPRAETPSRPAEATVLGGPPRTAADDGATVVAPRRPEPAAEPAIDPDATRLEGPPPAPAPVVADEGPAGSRFEAGRWMVVVESEEGEEKERLHVPKAMTTVGRQTDNPELRADLVVANAPHVSRRQLALVWAPRGERPGFTVYNVGLNALHVGDKEIPGANRGKGELRLDELMQDHTEWVSSDVAMRVGEHGPVLRIVDTRGGDAGGGDEDGKAEDGVAVDPDATQLG